MIFAVNFPILTIGKKKPEKIRASTGFEPRDLREYRCDALPNELWSHTFRLRAVSLNWRKKRDGSQSTTHWERDQFIELISPVRSEMMWSMYEIIHIWSAAVHVKNDLFQANCGFIAQLVEHRGTDVRGGHGFESRWSPDFFRLLLSNCLNWKINCEDHPLLSCAARASHRLLLSNCLNWKINCGDHSLLSEWKINQIRLFI